MSEVFPKFLYDNAMRRATLSYSGSEVSGFGKSNAVDWRDFSMFRAAAGTTNLDATVAANETVDSCGVFVKGRASSVTLVLKYESSPSTYTDLATIVVPGDELDYMEIVEFDEITVSATRKIRWEIQAGAAVVDIRQLCIGPIMTAQRGQFAGVLLPNSQFGQIISNVIAVNGSVIGRSVRRYERQGTVDLEYLTGAWVRETWEPFVAHAERFAFFYQWHPETYPEEVVWASALQINPARQMETIPYLAAGMNIHIIAPRKLHEL